MATSAEPADNLGLEGFRKTGCKPADFEGGPPIGPHSVINPFYINDLSVNITSK